MGGQHLAQGLGGEQWDVAVGDDDGAGEVGRQRGETALDGAAGALDLVLIGDEAVGVALGDVGSDEVTFVPHDDLEVDGVDASGCRDRMVDQAAPTDGVQDLRHRRLHPGALARGEDDDCCRARWRHVERSYRSPRLPGAPTRTATTSGTVPPACVDPRP